MVRHIVETVSDDTEALKHRLDSLASEGAEVISVVWHPNSVVHDQAAALDGSGSFVIIAREGSTLSLHNEASLNEIPAAVPVF